MCCNIVRSFATPLLLVLAWSAVASAQDIDLYNGNGGAARGVNTDLDLRDMSFVDYAATGYGGAIYFEVNGHNANTLTLGASGLETREMSRNEQLYRESVGAGTANSITFAAPATNDYGIAHFEMIVEGANNFFNMNDPLYVVTGSNLILNVNKSGQGTWNLYGNSNLSGATLGARFTISDGTLVLGNGSALNLTSASRYDSLVVEAGAELYIGNTGISGADVEIKTNAFLVSNLADLYLDKNLNLTLYSQSTARSAIDGNLSGTGGLHLKGDGTLEFTGSTSNFSGSLNLEGGNFIVNSSNSFETTGHIEFGNDTGLSVFVNSNRPSIKAGSITINKTHLTISGIYGSTGTYVLLESDQAIQGDFFDDSSQFAKVNYLTADFGFSSADNPSSSDYRRRYEGSITLLWDPHDDTKENGVFDIDPSNGATDYFIVGTVLKDSTAYGKSLTKRGRGTLELASANEYTGNTFIENGTLKLTDAQGAGTTGIVNVYSSGALELDFNKAFSQRITGEGKVVKSGESTVRLTNVNNDYTGGTVFQSGVLSVADGRALGGGTLSFKGGKLLLEGGSTGYLLTQSVNADQWSDAWFESAGELELTSTITGEGGLRKTGTGTLILSGQGAYTGDTKIEEGTLVLNNSYALGKGDLVLSDGVRFQNGRETVNKQNVVLKHQSSKAPDGVLFDIRADLVQNGDISGAGKLVKIGSETLTLAGENTFTGGLVLREGDVEFSSQKNLGDGAILFDGGTLRNTAAIENLTSTLTTQGAQKIRLETRENLTIASDIMGEGGLHKTGEATLTLTGANQYRGETRIYDGTLINDGDMDSRVYVENGGALGGSGHIYNSVHFLPGSAYQWNFGLSEIDSSCLTIGGDVYLDNTMFRPVTAGAMEVYPDVIESWTVLRYAGELKGDKEFAGIDNEFSPFYDFELDYSQDRVITVTGYHRRDPRPLSDSVAMGIVMAQRRVHRRAFEQVDKELQDGRDLGLRSVRGQSARFSSHAWADINWRSSEYESSYHKNHPWRLTSFGAQVGYSFLSSSWLSIGVTAGVEFPKLKNYLDRVKATDGYLGLYYGQRIYNMWEIKGYFGGGTQRYQSCRSDTKYNYRSKYHGDSFEASVELGRPFLLGACMVRPHVGFDFGYAGQQAAKENQSSAEYRTYSEVSLTQVYVRVGIDLQRTYSRSDGFFGVSYSNMIGGQSLPSVRVYYPTAKSGTTVYGTKLGQNMFTFRTGGNLYLDDAKTRSFFLSLTADLFTDRQDGKAEFSGSFGYDYRF